MKKVVSEEEAIRALEAFLEEMYPPQSLLTPPEDAHDIIIDNKRLIVSVDGNSEEYARYPWEKRFDWAWRSLVGPLADIVAKGARPLAFTVDLGIPRGIDTGSLHEIARGLAEAARLHNVYFLGGDTNRSGSDSAWISVTAIGLAGKRTITRKGGKSGEGIFTTLVNGYGIPGILRWAYYDSQLRKTLLGKVKNLRWRPRAPLAFHSLVESLNVSSSIDSSDGLLRSLILLSRSSGLTICLHRLPPLSGASPDLVETILNVAGKRVVEKSILDGGEEYEIIFSTSEDEKVVYNKCSNKGLPCMKIGEYCSPGKGRVIYNDKTLSEGGWDNLHSTL